MSQVRVLSSDAFEVAQLVEHETMRLDICGISSFGRTSACHAEGDGFKSRISLHCLAVPWRVRERKGSQQRTWCEAHTVGEKLSKEVFVMKISLAEETPPD